MNLTFLLRRVIAPPIKKPKPAPTRDSVIEYIRKHPECTMKEIQKATQLSDRSIASWMHRLHKSGIITRRQYGSTHFGGRPRYVFSVNSFSDIIRNKEEHIMYDVPDDYLTPEDAQSSRLQDRIDYLEATADQYYDEQKEQL